VRIERDGETTVVVVQPEGPRMTIDEFWNTMRSPAGLRAKGPQSAYGYLCQAVVDQHPVLAALHPESLNTARLWLFQPEPGNWEVFAAVLRMGVGAMSVDNTDAGGIFSPVDVESGKAEAATNVDPEHPLFPVHPTTNARIKGLELPMWDDVISICRRAGAAFPYLRVMGVDVAFSKTHPLVVELEAEPHATHQISFGRGVQIILDRLAASRGFGAKR
jgi:hypothetical protein